MKKYLYKVISMILATTMLVSSVSCGTSEEKETENKKNASILKNTSDLASAVYTIVVGVAQLPVLIYKDKKGLIEPPETYRTRTMARHNTVVEALVEKDSDKLKSVLCEILLQEPDLEEQIERMFEAVDGELIETDSRTCDRTYYVKIDGIVEQCSMSSLSRDVITGDGKKYEKLIINSQDANSKHPESIGVTSITLLRKYPNDGISIKVH